MIEYVFLDLDGTLTDPMLGITNSVMHALKRFSIEENDREKLTCFIGPPLMDSFMNYYGFNKSQAREALGFYREYFSVKGIYENRVYHGCEAFLSSLVHSGKKVVLASSKPEEYAKRILDHFSLSQHFHFIGGSDTEETKVKKEDVISYCLKEIGHPAIAHCVMVGDRKHDIIGAKAHGMACIGVTYGFGSLEELKTAGADYIATTFDEIKEILFKL